MWHKIRALMAAVAPKSASSIDRASGKPPRTGRFRPGLELLEDRRMLAVSVAFEAYDYSYFYGLLKIEGTSAGDTVSVSEVRYRDQVVVTANGVSTTFANPSDGYNGSKIRSVVFHGRGGDDQFINNSSLRSEAHGEDGSDYFYGGTNVDLFFGGDDTDYLYGKGGADELHGGADLDYLYGGADNDNLDGGDDGRADELHGGYGRDKFQMEGHGPFGSPILAYVNLDHPKDFNPAEDSLYGEDPLETLGDVDNGSLNDDPTLDEIYADLNLAATLEIKVVRDYASAVDQVFTSNVLYSTKVARI
jgi:hypothetical protein